MVNTRLAAWFEEYDAAHRHPTTRLTHAIAIPLIVFQLIAIGDWITIFENGALRISLSHLGIVFWGCWYLWVSLPLGALMIALFAACLAGGWITPWWAVLAIGGAAWVVQIGGHIVWEKNSPAFTKSLVHTLIGPLYFAAELVGAWPRRRLEHN